MRRGSWTARCDRPDDLAWPLTAGRTGAADLTWWTAQGKRYEKVGRGLYVPVDRARSPEQRAIDAAARLRPDGSGGCVTGWAALRWRGAAYFDGLEADGTEVPVQLVVPTYAGLSPRPGVSVERRWIPAEEVEVVDGLPCAVPARALFDEVHRRGRLWSAVQAIDMAAAARLISVWLFGLFLGACNSRNGVPLAREAAALAVDESWSPMEPWHRLVWGLVAGLPEPLVNVPVYTLGGRLLGHPDLFDPTTGTAGEFNGEVHAERAQRRRDVARREDFLAHGVEVVEVVGGDTARVAAERMQRVHRRARESFATRPRLWTLEPPAGTRPAETLDEYFVRTGQAERLSVYPFEVGRVAAA